MFCTNNDNYMQDLYFYNQQPNTYNPYMNNMGNTMQNNNMMSCPMNNMSQPNMFMGQNNMGMSQMQNPNNLYPSIYRIINPVVSRVIANSNYQFLNEEALNNMVDTVYNIVEGQIDYEDDSNQANASSSETGNTVQTVANSQSTNSRVTQENQRQINQSQNTSNSRNTRNDNLLRDLIKILILKELFSRNQFQGQRQFNPNQYYTPQFNMNY